MKGICRLCKMELSGDTQEELDKAFSQHIDNRHKILLAHEKGITMTIVKGKERK